MNSRLDKLNNNYKDLTKIGEGTYGQVFKATETATGNLHALKKVSLDRDGEGIPSTCIREITLLKSLDHVNIIKLMDVISSGQEMYLVFEYIDRDLKVLLDLLPGKKLPLEYVKSFFFQLLQALSYCHTHRIIHRDLKPQNILVTASGNVKLADFGLARCFSIPSRVYTHEIVTLWYRAPEVLLGTKYYSTAIDIWSLACILPEMVMGTPLFHGDSEVDQLFAIFRTLGTPHNNVWPGVECLANYSVRFPQWRENKLQEKIGEEMPVDGVTILQEMLRYKPDERLTAKSALTHRFLCDVPLNLPPVTNLIPKRR